MGSQPTHSSQVQSTSNQSKSEPHPYIQNDLLGLLGSMSGWLSANPNAPGYVPGGTVAPRSQRTIATNSDLYARGAAGFGSGIDPAMRGLVADTLAGKNLDVGANPYFQANLDAINQRQNEVWRDTVFPAINSTFAGAGRTAGGLHGANVVRSTNDLARAQADAGTAAMSNLFDAERGRQMQTLNFLPTLQGMDYGNIEARLRAGANDDAYAQRLRDDATNRYWYEAYAQPDFLTGMAQRYLGMFPGGQTLGSGTTMGWNTAGGGGGGFDSIMSGIGRVMPLLVGSDRRMKTDIEELGVDRRTKLPMYAYRYRGDPKTYPKVVGPMAQDIEKRCGPVREISGRKVIRMGGLM